VRQLAEDNVCTHKTIWFLPVVPLQVMINPRNNLFYATWAILTFFFLVLWLLAPCNPDLNCTKGGKDVLKALYVSALIVYALLFLIALITHFTYCSKAGPKVDYSITRNTSNLLFKPN
jgi:hypothetical protein